MEGAQTIYQAFLDQVSAALMAGDIADISRSMAYPQELKTNDGFLTVKDAAQMTKVVKDYRAFLLQLGATDYHRICDWADIDTTGSEIVGEHVTYVVKGGSFAVEPFRSRMILQRVGGAWMGAGNSAEVSNRTCTILSPTLLRASQEAET